jgi:hypothetical protein
VPDVPHAGPRALVARHSRSGDGRQGTDAAFFRRRRQGAFEVTNSGVGHAFATYAVPTIMMNAVALDGYGAPRPETLQSHMIARRVHYDNATSTWHELRHAASARAVCFGRAGVERQRPRPRLARRYPRPFLRHRSVSKRDRRRAGRQRSQPPGLGPSRQSDRCNDMSVIGVNNGSGSARSKRRK